MVKDLLFKKVKCCGFLRKVNDGRYIVHDEVWNCQYVKYDKKNHKIIYEDVPEEDYYGSFNFLKTYYEKKEQNFSGVVVGFKDIVLTGYLYIDTYRDYFGHEHPCIGKEPKDRERCAIIYYANNRKHLVPVGMIKSED